MAKIGEEIQFYDINKTWSKINGKLDDFINKICGKDLAELAFQYAETVYNRYIKKAIKVKDSRVNACDKQLQAIETGPLKLTISRKS